MFTRSLHADMPQLSLHNPPSPTVVDSPTPDRESATRPLARDVAIETFPADARQATARAIGHYVAEQLRAGRSLFNVLADSAVAERIGTDGRALTTRPAEAGA